MSVEEFFANRCVLVTGATGFLGKVLLEKLLRCCPRVETVYLLLRSRGGHPPRQRLQELLRSEVFDRIRKENDQLLLKLRPVSGEITADGLGLSVEDTRDLEKNVSVVIHAAATIRFDEPISRAIEINVRATFRVLQLCYRMKDIKALVHVSTAYCTPCKENIEEAVCQEPLSVAQFLKATKWMNSDLFSSSSNHLLAGRPTSYHYTKALAETLLFQEYGDVPISIVRPSIITASWKEPMPGWIDNFNGPSGYLVSSGKGVLRTIYGHKDKICDMIPVDVVANTIISAAWSTGTNTRLTAPIVYNCTSGSINPITWGQLRDISHPLLIKNPSMQIFRFPSSNFHSNRLIHGIFILLEHNIPAFLVDLIFKMTGHKPILSQVYTKVHRSINALEYFTTNEWTFNVDNFLCLMKSLNKEDKKTFFMNVDDVKWCKYMENYVLGVRSYLLREDPATLPEARMRLRRVYLTTQLIKLGIIVAVTHQLARRKSVLLNFFNTLLRLALR